LLIFLDTRRIFIRERYRLQSTFNAAEQLLPDGRDIDDGPTWIAPRENRHGNASAAISIVVICRGKDCRPSRLNFGCLAPGDSEIASGNASAVAPSMPRPMTMENPPF
jgi:hypothetical protein